MKTKEKSIFFICLAMIVSGVILFSVIYSGQMVSAAQRVETYKDNGEDESEMTQESIQSQEKTVREQAEYMEELEEDNILFHLHLHRAESQTRSDLVPMHIHTDHDLQNTALQNTQLLPDY